MSLPGKYDLPEPPTPEESSPTDLTDKSVPADSAIKAERQQDLVSNGYPAKAITAFVVILTEEGVWIGNSNLVGRQVTQRPDGTVGVIEMGSLPPLDAMEIRRPATLQEMVHGTLVVGADAERAIAVEMTASSVQARMMQQAAHMAQQQEAARILNRVQGNGRLSGR